MHPRRRRCLGRRGRAGARAGHVDALVRRDDRIRGLRGRGAGRPRLDVLRRAGEGRGRRRRRSAFQPHDREQPRDERHSRAERGSPLCRGPSGERDTGRGGGPAGDRRRERHAPAPARPVHPRGGGEGGAERGLPAPAAGRANGGRRPVRRPARVRGLRIRGRRHAGEPRRAHRSREWPCRSTRPQDRSLRRRHRLEWERNTDPDLAGYEIVYRETTAPYWQHAIPVGDVTDFTVAGITQDSFLLGVQAVDRDGNRSVVAFPAPR